MSRYRNLAALTLLIALAMAKHTFAENWVRPFADDAYWWVDLDSAQGDSNGNRIFKLHMGANPKGRYDPVMNYTRWAAVNCSTATIYHYNETSKTWDGGDGGSDFGRAIVPLVCR